MSIEPIHIALDLETTGLDPGSDRIVEIGAVAFDGDGRVIETFEHLVNPSRPISETARAINGITDEELAAAPPASDVLPGLLAMLDRAASGSVIAHNAAFDAGFLGMELARAGLEIPDRSVLDTLPLSRALLPGVRSHRLDALLAHFQIAPSTRHRALADAHSVKDLWFRLGGPTVPEGGRTCYPIRDGSLPIRPPLGWERLDEALAQGRSVRMTYEGGTRGAAPRLVTPRSFAHRGGIPYLVATCHLDAIEKSFRLDRIRCYEILS